MMMKVGAATVQLKYNFTYAAFHNAGMCLFDFDVALYVLVYIMMKPS